MFLIARQIALKKNRSKVKTALLPLSCIKKAFVLLDSTGQDYVHAKKNVKEFFEGHGIEVDILAPGKKDLDLLHRIKKKYRIIRDEDLFLSLYPINRFEAEYEAKCSGAKFKIGRYPFREPVFDLIVHNRENEYPEQWEVFESIKDLLEKIK